MGFMSFAKLKCLKRKFRASDALGYEAPPTASIPTPRNSGRT
jgi:hypothetical protein